MAAIPVANASGLTLSGLVIGTVYSLWTTGGPWNPHGITDHSDDTWAFQLSNDGGSTWSGRIVAAGDPFPGTFVLPPWCSARRDLDSVHVQVTFTATTTSIQIRVADAVFTDNTGSLDAEIANGAVPFCTYGTEVQPSVTAGVILTTAVIDAIMAAAGVSGWIIPIFDGLVGAVIYGGQLCSSNPPLMPVFTNDDFIAGTQVPNAGSFGKVLQAFEAIAWPYFCQCTPAPTGSPAPIPPPTPTALPPAAAPTGVVTLVCDNSDICTYLSQLNRQMSAIQNQLIQLRSDVTLIQRQHVPFAYIPGTLHSGLTGNGQFSVQGILAVSAQVTTLPPNEGEEDGNPVARFGLGWITTGTADGWRRSVPIAANPQWVDVAPDDTLIGYSLTPLTVANIQEFSREP